MDLLSLIESDIKSALQAHGLMQYFLSEESQFLNVGYYSIQIVLSDGNKIREAEELLWHVQARFESEKGSTFEYSVRAKWDIERVGESEDLRTADGNITAASVVLVELRSGTRTTPIHVIVTWEAFQTLKNLLNRDFNMREVAEAICRDMLLRGGTSAWDPLKKPTVQINSATALYVSRLLLRAA